MKYARHGSYQLAARIRRQAHRITCFRILLLRWFGQHARQFPWRHQGASLYAQVVSELLLQRTRAETVATFFPRFIARFPGWEHLARATDAEMRLFLEPIGLWRRRARTLRELGNSIVARRGSFPRNRGEIEQLPGIGQYVASAVMIFCHRASEPLLDTNMARVLERVFGPRKLADIRYDPWLQRLAREVVRSRHARQLNWAILDLAATICTIKSPGCPTCPVRTTCLYAIRRRATVKCEVPKSRKVCRCPDKA